jgi:hypothetical protein
MVETCGSVRHVDVEEGAVVGVGKRPPGIARLTEKNGRMEMKALGSIVTMCPTVCELTVPLVSIGESQDSILIQLPP